MVEVKTSEGVIQCPDTVGPRTKYWASVIRDVTRTEELYLVMGAALEEAYKAGVIGGLHRFMEGFQKLGEVVDAEYEVVDAEYAVVQADKAESVASGPEPAGSALPDPGSVPSGPTTSGEELPGGVPESSRS